MCIVVAACNHNIDLIAKMTQRVISFKFGETNESGHHHLDQVGD